MQFNVQNVLGIIGAPSREDSLAAISKCLLRIRSEHGLTNIQIGKVLECHADCVANAIAEKNLLSLDTVARLGYFFPEEFKVIEQLWTYSAAPLRTVPERIDSLHRELDRIKRELVA